MDEQKCDRCGGELHRSQGVSHMGYHVVHRYPDDCARHLTNRAEAAERRVAELEARLAEMEARADRNQGSADVLDTMEELMFGWEDDD